MPLGSRQRSASAAWSRAWCSSTCRVARSGAPSSRTMHARPRDRGAPGRAGRGRHPAAYRFTDQPAVCRSHHPLAGSARTRGAGGDFVDRGLLRCDGVAPHRAALGRAQLGASRVASTILRHGIGPTMCSRPSGLIHRSCQPCRMPAEVVGQVSAHAGAETGLRPGTPVIAGSRPITSPRRSPPGSYVKATSS